jgi:ubiquinone/menaquinone biosynthesis C-methylase UbiE
LRDRGSIKPRVFTKPLVVAALWGSLFVAGPQIPIFQAAQPQRSTSTPYAGDLSIFETPGRDERLQIHRVMDLLGIKAGTSVADIGAGSGWFSVRAAARVGKSGTVYAEDINPQAVKFINDRLNKDKSSNLRTVLGSTDDPKLPGDSIDAALLLKVYHEIAHPRAFMSNLKPSLRSGARVGIIDRNGNGENHGLASDVVKREMAEAGFKLLSSYDFTKADGQDYFLIFAAK